MYLEKSVSCYLLEGEHYYSLRTIALPAKITTYHDSFYLCSNMNSIVLLFTVFLLRNLGKKVLFMPDGILEVANIKRKNNIIGAMVMRMANGIIVSDHYSLLAANALKMNAIKSVRWKQIDKNELIATEKEFLLCTARKPYFTVAEKNKLLHKLQFVFDDIALVANKIDFSMAKDIYEELLLGKGRVTSNFIKAMDAIKYKKKIIVSGASTVLIEVARRGLQVSFIRFRNHEALMPDFLFWPNIITAKELFLEDVGRELDIKKTIFSWLYAIENQGKIIFTSIKNFLCSVIK